MSTPRFLKYKFAALPGGNPGPQHNMAMSQMVGSAPELDPWNPVQHRFAAGEPSEQERLEDLPAPSAPDASIIEWSEVPYEHQKRIQFLPFFKEEDYFCHGYTRSQNLKHVCKIKLELLKKKMMETFKREQECPSLGEDLVLYRRMLEVEISVAEGELRTVLAWY